MSDFTFKHTFTANNPGRLDEYYDVSAKEMLGEGSYGQVSKGVNKATKAVRAIKAISIAQVKDPARFQGEIDIQMDLDHPNIVKLYETFKDAKKIYLVMELCSGGELFDRIVEESEKHGGAQAFSEKDVAKYMSQIMGAVQYLHARCYAHRDIKPENFLMQSKDANAEIKVIDFGLAKCFKNGEMLKTKAGTPYYVAPEVLKGGGYNEKCDIWSCGVIAYILTCGYPPFYGDTDQQILRRVKKGEFDFPSPDWNKVSNELKDMIKLMLTMDPDKRISAAQLFDTPWMKKAAADQLETAVALDGGIARNMKQFRCASKLKKVVLTMIAQNLKDSDLQQLRANFIALDKDKNGTLTKAELSEGLQKGNVELPEDFAKVLDGLDTDGSDTIDYSEFIAATLTRKQYMKEEQAWAAFRIFDKDNDGCITKKELDEIIKDMKVSDEIMKEVDADGNGTISFEEFKVMLDKDDSILSIK